MFASVQDAVRVINESGNSSLDYRLACEYLVDHREELQQRVFICLPGGLTGNEDSAWDSVKAGSDERCDCGNERVITPRRPRTEFLASSVELVVVPGTTVYLKPIGGDKASTNVSLDIKQEALTFLNDPFAPLVLTPDIFSIKGFKLDTLANILPKQPKPPVYVREFVEDVNTPIFAITAVDLKSQTVTIIPDAAVESFNPDELPDHSCA